MFKSLFGRKKEQVIKNPNWHFLTISKDNRDPVIRGLAHDLVEELYPKEADIFDLVADELLSSHEIDQPIRATEAVIAGLPLGNLSELGSVKVLSYVGVIYTLLAERFDESMSLPAAAATLRDDPNLTGEIIEKLNRELGIEPSMAMDIWEKSLMLIAPKYNFVYHQVVTFEENNTCEFKKCGNWKSIPDLVDEYAVAYSNAEGGRIFFGICNDGRVEGVDLPNPGKKDEIRQNIINMLVKINPPLSIGAVEIEFHPVFLNGREDPSRFVVEVVIPKPIKSSIYRTSHGSVYVKTASGTKICTPEEVEILQISKGLLENRQGAVQ